MANTRVLEAMRKDARLRGMGTTVVACLAEDETVSVAHVGDSRAYLIRDGALSRITNDHSWVFEQVQAGMLTEAEAEKHPLRNVITRALGGASAGHARRVGDRSETGRRLPALFGRPHGHGP